MLWTTAGGGSYHARVLAQVSRREVLRGASALSGVAALAASGLRSFAELLPRPTSTAAHGAGEVKSGGAIRLGIASYTFRKFYRAQLVEDMKQLRLRGVNLKDVHLPMGPSAEVKAAADELRAAGLELTAVGAVSFNKNDDEDVRAKFEYARAAGVPVIVAAPTREVLPRVERFAREYGMRIAIHNHGPEDKQFPSPLDVLAAVEHMDPRMGCCVDVGHCMRAGVDPVEAILRAGPRVFDVHMKDLAKRDDKESQVAVGEGLMPVRGIFEALIKLGYKGWVDLEYEIHENDPMPGVVESVAYMRGVLRGMGVEAAG